ncbi:RluA family pseudouridine synthase [Terrilactibacillus laevilacticus]|uniref:Pseudouridine synthase n=1 Tax=Terrilactibacillus laevilacticus TaxID=1380157 RepID=A0ABW5PQG2_9BACI|nr:RluA family pseudouridine synthase [Terrilactibacillus laevilacticus]
MKQPYRIETIVSPKYNGLLLKSYLLQEQKISKAALKSIKFNGGDLLVNGMHQTVRYVLSEGDKVTILFPPEEKSTSLVATPFPLDIVFEDDHLLVINKPSQMPVIPSYRYPTHSLANGVLAHLEKQNLAYTVHTVTRLDRDTSGLILIAKHRHAHDAFFKMQLDHLVHRRYIAVVEGSLDEKQGVIDAPIGRKEGSIIERSVVEKGGKTAITHYKVIKEDQNHSTAVVQLKTGRTHQIRVHFSYLGHPLAGDDLYGGTLTYIDRQALHSFELSFVHPFTHKSMSFRAQYPEDMRFLIREDINLEMI